MSPQKQKLEFRLPTVVREYVHIMNEFRYYLMIHNSNIDIIIHKHFLNINHKWTHWYNLMNIYGLNWSMFSFKFKIQVSNSCEYDTWLWTSQFFISLWICIQCWMKPCNEYFSISWKWESIFLSKHPFHYSGVFHKVCSQWMWCKRFFCLILAAEIPNYHSFFQSFWSWSGFIGIP